MVCPPKDLRTFDSLLEIVKSLRGRDGCPWDKEQTHRSLTPYVIEEAHELAEAIEQGDKKEMISELGDVLLQVVLHSEIGRQEKTFDVSDVIYAISEKMVRRHPHVFSDVAVKDSKEVLSNWAEIKEQEKKGKGATAPTKFEIPTALPALTRSQKIGDKTKKVRFDWSSPREVLAKVDEELAEVKEEMDKPKLSAAALEHEIGDLLFTVAQLARHLGLEAEQCLRSANARFENRYFKMRKAIEDGGQRFDDLSLDELEQAWRDVKIALKGSETKR
jgi:tetrapyrrole methylase family protein/MazG family protein